MMEMQRSFREVGNKWVNIFQALTNLLLQLLWNPKVCYRVHKGPPLVPILTLPTCPSSPSVTFVI
jgi:hypothetical protein